MAALSGLSSGYDPNNLLQKGFQIDNSRGVTPTGAPAQPAGQTLAATTTAPAPQTYAPATSSGIAAPATTAPAPPPAPNYDQLKAGVNNQYDQIIAALDAQAGFIPEERSNLEKKVSSLFSGTQGEIESARAGANEDLDQSGLKIDSRQASSIRELEENVRGQFESGRRLLGAGTGSGADMFAYALSKLSTQQKSQILQQANELHADLDVERSKVTRTYDDQITQLGKWQDQQMIDIENWVLQQKKDIQNRKLTANASRQQELNQILAQTIASAEAYANGVAQQAADIQAGIDQWAQQRMQGVDALSGQIQQGVLAIDPSQIQGNFDPGTGYFNGTAFDGGLSFQTPQNSPFMTALVGNRRDEQ